MNWLIVLMALVMVAALGYVIVSQQNEIRRLKANRSESDEKPADGESKNDNDKGDEKPEPEKEGGQK